MFDGHSGVDAADYACLNVVCNLTRNANFSSDIQKALREAFMETDEQFCMKARAEVSTECVTQSNFVYIFANQYNFVYIFANQYNFVYILILVINITLYTYCYSV